MELLLVLAGFAAVLACAWWYDRRRGRFYALLEHAARRAPGTAVAGEALEGSGTGWKAETRFQRRPAFTKVEFEFVRSVPALRIRRAGVVHRLAHFFGVRECDLDEPRFRVSAADLEDARRFLTDAVREAFVWLSERPGMVFEVAGTRGRVWTEEFPTNEDRFVEFLRCVYRLADALLAAEGTGFDSIEGTCQVCGQKLEGQVVRCAKCATPHHRECWEYLERCSTYACGERRFA